MSAEPAPGQRFAPWHQLAPGRIVRDSPARPPRQEPGRPTLADVERAASTIRAHVVRTPLIELELPGMRAWAKLETRQRTGSMKARGAANSLLALGGAQRAAGVVTASSGNHGRALAELAAELGIPATVCVPGWVDAVKLDAIRASGATVRAESAGYDDAVLLANGMAAREGMTYVHSFDDPLVIAGQGTVGLELCEQAPGLDAVLIPLSGGGLCSGVALALRGRSPGTRLIGVSAANAAVLYHCLLAGRGVAAEELPTIASALSGGLGEHNSHSLAIVAALLDEVWLVQEREIARAMLWMQERLGERVEGGGAVTLAALLRADAAAALPRADADAALRAAGPARDPRPPRVAAVISGGNVDEQTVARARALAA